MEQVENIKVQLLIIKNGFCWSGHFKQNIYSAMVSITWKSWTDKWRGYVAFPLIVGHRIRYAPRESWQDSDLWYDGLTYTFDIHVIILIYACVGVLAFCLMCHALRFGHGRFSSGMQSSEWVVFIWKRVRFSLCQNKLRIHSRKN